MAYSLLGEFKAVRVLVDQLNAKDRQNIEALMVDEKYISLLKLQGNICALWIQQHMHEDGERKEMKKGGVMIYTTVQKAVETMFKQSMQDDAEEKQVEETLNGIGW